MPATDRSVNLFAALGILQGTDYKESKEPAGAPRRHVITISREAGALGTTTAHAIGERPGWPVYDQYDQEILNRIGQEMGLHVNMVKLIDERPMNWLEECIAGLVSDYHLSHDRYMIQVIAMVRALAEEGNCIIVGRGANFLLPRETTLNVRLIGELNDRVAHVQKKLGLSKPEAVKWVEKTSKHRHDFVKHHFGKNVEDPLLYDLVLNTSRFSADECAEVIVAALNRKLARRPAAAAAAAAARV
jgi:cytidylate kinase